MGSEKKRNNPDAPSPGPFRHYRPEELGHEFDHGYNPQGYQRKEKVAVLAKCPTCHKEVALVAETEEWEQRDDATWEHVGWGPASGVCCDNLIVQFTNGYEIYPLPSETQGGDRG
jgi:hypothetical protein